MTHVWTEPFDESVADRALARLEAIDYARTLVPIPRLPTADHCDWCPYFRRHQPTDAAGCAGHHAERRG